MILWHNTYIIIPRKHEIYQEVSSFRCGLLELFGCFKLDDNKVWNNWSEADICNDIKREMLTNVTFKLDKILPKIDMTDKLTQD